VNLAGNQHVRFVTMSGGQVKLNAGPTIGSRVIDTAGVSAPVGKLDITNGRLVVDYTPGSSPILSIRSQIISAYNAGGTLWAGNGITSSSVIDANTYGVGYGEASDVIGAGGGSFGPEVVDGSSVVARYTRLGDANLDGVVNFSDMVRLAQNYNNVSGTMWWSQGDFTYDGKVDFNDLIRIAQSYGMAAAGEAVPAGAPVSFEQDLAAAFASVPEPGAIGFVGSAGLVAMGRRKRLGR
jgi:hypothetical protein